MIEQDLTSLKRTVLDMGSLVEQAVHKALWALGERRPEVAEQVDREDDVIDQKELEVEKECTRILALHHPVARDLRFVVTVLNLNHDLERIGDLATNIAERAASLCASPGFVVPTPLKTMMDCAPRMLRTALDAFMREDSAMARRVRADDDEVDDCNREMWTLMQAQMREDIDSIPQYLNLLSCSQQLERIADLATNLSEAVVFLVEGDLIRHRL
ncbi:MAG: phosphate signaling complex protein PhoU [Planctomycetota bacterium]